MGHHTSHPSEDHTVPLGDPCMAPPLSQVLVKGVGEKVGGVREGVVAQTAAVGVEAGEELVLVGHDGGDSVPFPGQRSS